MLPTAAPDHDGEATVNRHPRGRRGEPGEPANTNDRFNSMINTGSGRTTIGRQAAIAKAIAATPGNSRAQRVWTSVDAVLTSGGWICILEDTRTAYVVFIDRRTGAAIILTAERTGPPAPRGAGRPRAPLFVCRIAG